MISIIQGIMEGSHLMYFLIDYRQKLFGYFKDFNVKTDTLIK